MFRISYGYRECWTFALHDTILHLKASLLGTYFILRWKLNTVLNPSLSSNSECLLHCSSDQGQIQWGQFIEIPYLLEYNLMINFPPYIS